MEEQQKGAERGSALSRFKREYVLRHPEWGYVLLHLEQQRTLSTDRSASPQPWPLSPLPPTCPALGPCPPYHLLVPLATYLSSNRPPVPLAAYLSGTRPTASLATYLSSNLDSVIGPSSSSRRAASSQAT